MSNTIPPMKIRTSFDRTNSPPIAAPPENRRCSAAAASIASNRAGTSAAEPPQFARIARAAAAAVPSRARGNSASRGCLGSGEQPRHRLGRQPRRFRTSRARRARLCAGPLFRPPISPTAAAARLCIFSFFLLAAAPRPWVLAAGEARTLRR